MTPLLEEVTWAPPLLVLGSAAEVDVTMETWGVEEVSPSVTVVAVAAEALLDEFDGAAAAVVVTAELEEDTVLLPVPGAVELVWVVA